MTDLYLTSSIPYVNGNPHLGHALELVQVDALARHRAAAGASVRVQSGTDDHAIKNVTAAAQAGVPVPDFVRRHGDRFARLSRELGVHTDEFLRTSSDPRHRTGVAALWQACADRGDLYLKDYTGLYCAGCEQFCTPEELTGGACPEHPGGRVARVTERNWFFRLSTYRERVAELIRSGAVEVTPDRAPERGARLPWPTMSPGSATAPARTEPSAAGGPTPSNAPTSSARGVIRFHAVYWLALLLSARLPLPSRILVHDYLTVDGAKIAKSGVQAADPLALVQAYGQDALRWWLLSAPAPVGGTDFTVDRLVSSYNQDLANTVGNLASRTLTLARRTAPWRTAAVRTCGDLRPGRERLADVVGEHVSGLDFRAAGREIVDLAATANRFLEAEAPWELARAADHGVPGAADEFEAAIDAALSTCSTIADALGPLVPAGAGRLRSRLSGLGGPANVSFPRLLPDATSGQGACAAPSG